MNEIRKPDPVLRRFMPHVRIHPEVNYIPSQYAFPLEFDGKKYVINTLTRQILETDLPESARMGEGFDSLIEGFFLVPEGKDECAFYTSISSLIRAYSFKKGIWEYTILPTLRCNARCVYCYEEGMEQVSMAPEIVDRTVRYILDNRRGDKVRLSWFGGEPLLGIATIDRICEALQKEEIEYESDMISNGSLITEEVISKMTGLWKLGQIQISMDGEETDYKSRKKYYSYRDYYRSVIAAVDRMSESGISVSIRCNVDEINWKRVPVFLENLADGIVHKENVSVYFCPLNEVRKGQKDLHLWSEIIAMRSMIQKLGFGVQYANGTSGRFRVFHCMADSGNVVITPDGALFPCEHCLPGSRFGDIFQGITDEEARHQFCRTDLVREKCRACTFLPECTSFGNCPIQDTHCQQIRELFAVDYLKMLLEKKEQDQGDRNDTLPLC